MAINTKRLPNIIAPSTTHVCWLEKYDFEYVALSTHSKEYYSDDELFSMAEVAVQWNNGYDEVIESFANNISTTEGGTHETGFKSALTKVMNDYAKKLNDLGLCTMGDIARYSL